MRTRGLLAVGLFLAGAATIHAQTVTAEKVSCVPVEDNGLVKATISSLAVGQSPRLYFRWKGHEEFYWVPLEAEANGRYWATPPKPEKRNEAVEYYAAVADPAGKIVARSQTQTAPVEDDCKVQLTPKERGVAQNLTVGETSPAQEGQKVMAFLCDGIVTRINHAGIRRADDVCRACVIAFWPKKALLLPVVGVVGVIVTDEDPEPSPSRP